MTERTTCPVCGVESVTWLERRLGELVRLYRDYIPVTCVIRLNPEVKTSYIVPTSIESIVVHIRSLDDGKLSYAVDVPLWQYQHALEAFSADDRIEEWHTEESSANVCESHINFAKRTQPC